ncbi:MAG: hypothetical protein Q9213_007968 [Squamulea squamosa]
MEADGNRKVFTFRYVGPGETIAIGSVLPIVSIAVVGLRFYTRKRQAITPGLDDCCASLGWGLVFLTVRISLGQASAANNASAGVARKAMGYPTPPTPPNITGDQLVTYNPPSTELIGKASTPTPSARGTV